MYLKLLLPLMLFVATTSFAFKEYSLPYSVDSCKMNKNLSSNEAMVHFTMVNFPNYQINGSKPIPSTRTIIYSYGVKNEFAKLGSKDDFETKIIPGSYSFQLYINDQYEEITTGQIEIKAQHITYISCEFIMANSRVVVEKPVIYLYPTTPTEVTVMIAPKGELSFTYPLYKNGWKVIAEPNGEITHHEKKYNYLFWESEQKLTLKDLELTSGFTVTKTETIAFLEDKLSQFGLTSKEQADFITYWAPRMMRNNLNFVQFKFNDECNSFARLDISPTPNHVYRIYLQFFDMKQLKFSELHPQTIPTINRDGFTVIEWGGTEFENDIYF